MFVRNDRIDLNEIKKLDPNAIIISPGPGSPSDPRDFGICGAVLRDISTSIPTLGVCLGHQGIASIFGGKVRRAEALMHGKASMIYHDDGALYDGISNPFIGGRYHSLIVDPELPKDLIMAAHTADGVIMGIRHQKYPIEGVQFHPESILTPCGTRILGNFLREVKT